MYTYTPTHRFLVLSAADSAPFNPANKFLVLSPTESGPDPRGYDEQAVTEASAEESPDLTPSSLHRSDSSSSTVSSDSRFNGIVAALPNRYLYLGNTKTQKASQ